MRLRRRKFPAVFIKGAALKKIVEHSCGHYPVEIGGFLMADAFVDAHCPEVVDVYLSEHPGDATSWVLTEQELKKATKVAGMKGKTIIGTFHTHPFTPDEGGINFSSIIHSDQDADTQSKMGHLLSLVVAVTDSGLCVTAWKQNWTAPLEIFALVPGTDKPVKAHNFLSATVKGAWFGKYSKRKK